MDRDWMDPEKRRREDRVAAVVVNQMRLHNLPWYERLADKLAFLVMDIVAEFERYVWDRPMALDMYGRNPASAYAIQVVYQGWLPGRYV